MHQIYEGQLVRLRPFHSEDEVLRIFSEENRTPNAHWGPYHETVPAVRRDFADNGMISENGRRMYCIERLDSGEAVGYEEVGPLTLPRLTAWIGTFIRPEHQRRGFGMEAKQLLISMLFENHPLQTVMADTVWTHERARRGLELCGMRCLGIRPCCHYRQGGWVSVIYFQISRSEWEAMDYRHRVRRS
ncbi:GNAT family N-acetyltransferase [bacterium]|nr:GNAT family N-acetyltransferase [bacterium]